MQRQRSLVNQVNDKAQKIDTILPLDLLRTGDLEIFEGPAGELYLFREQTFDSLDDFIEQDAAKIQIVDGKLEVEKISKDNIDQNQLTSIEQVESQLLD